MSAAASLGLSAEQPAERWQRVLDRRRRLFSHDLEHVRHERVRVLGGEELQLPAAHDLADGGALALREREELGAGVEAEGERRVRRHLRGAGHVHEVCERDVGGAAQVLKKRLVKATVHLEHGVGATPSALAERAHGRDVHAAGGKPARKRRKDARPVLVRHEERGVVARDLHGDAVDGADAHATAAKGLSRHGHARVVRTLHRDGHGVGMEPRARV